MLPAVVRWLNVLDGRPWARLGAVDAASGMVVLSTVGIACRVACGASSALIWRGKRVARWRVVPG